MYYGINNIVVQMRMCFCCYFWLRGVLLDSVEIFEYVKNLLGYLIFGQRSLLVSGVCVAELELKRGCGSSNTQTVR